MFLRGNTLSLNKIYRTSEENVPFGTVQELGNAEVWDFWPLHPLRNAEQHDFAFTKGNVGRIRELPEIA